MVCREYPTGKAQQMVLDALNITATGSQDADSKFQKLGLVVASQRQGRRSVPAITVLSREDGAFSADGDGDSWLIDFDKADFSKIEQWIVK